MLTTQLCFDAVSDEVYRSAAYATRGERSQLNEGDGIYDESLLLTLEQAGGDGHFGLMTLDVQAT